jgi:hypothetical protein
LKIIALKWSSTSDAFTTSNTFTILFIYLVVVVGPVEMWKTDFTVAGKRFVFHTPCGNRCGKISPNCGKGFCEEVFHISTGRLKMVPVEMWKT